MNAPVISDALALYAKEDHVLLLPEHVHGLVPQVCYGKISRVDLGRVGVNTKKLPNYAAITVAVNIRLH